MLSKINLFFLLLVVGNLLALDYLFFFSPNKPTAVNVYPTPVPTLSPTITLSPTAIPTTTTVPTQANPPKRSSRSVAYLAIPGNGSTTTNSWVDVTGTDFYFDTTDYPNLSESYFSATIRLFNGNGTAFVRLFDVTAGIEVWGSEVTTNKQSFDYVTSGKLTLRPGRHLYRVQAKSLTADTAIYNFGHLRLVSSE